MLIRKNRWRRWLGMKGELWYYADKAEKTADRPHRYTIRLGFLSPVLAVVAAIISYEAFVTSRRSMEVGQKAYLAPKVRITAAPWTDPSVPERLRPPGTFVVNASVVIKNLGNTPAYFDSGGQGFSQFKSGKGEGFQSSEIWLETIPPKDEKSVLDTIVINTDELIGPTNFYEYWGDINWHDAFGAKHVEHWCTHIVTKQNNFIQAYDCDSTNKSPLARNHHLYHKPGDIF